MKSKTSRPHKKIKYIQILILITILITAFFVGIISMQFYNSSSRYLKQNFEDSIVNSVTQAAEYVNVERCKGVATFCFLSVFGL